MTTPEDLDARFRAAVGALSARPRRDPDEPVRDGSPLTGTLATALFDAQLASRHLDLAARWLRGFGEGYYTIGSSGHEGNAAVAAALRPTDPALLHYRSGAFYCARAAQVPGTDPIRDVLRGVVAASTEPGSGGRHKVFGHPGLSVIPMTSTIASHLPRAVGLGFAVERGRRLSTNGTRPAGRRDSETSPSWPSDAVVVCSFGDASVNHATAQAGLNTAGWCAHAGLPLPVLFVCEDNGIGISVRSPAGWVESVLRSRPGIRYFAADGCDLAGAYAAATEAAAYVRRHRRPAVLHLSTVRLMGHAGADAETAYRTGKDIAADLDRDPLIATATLLVESGVAKPDEVVARFDHIGWQVRTVAEEVIGEPKLTSAAEVAAPLAPRRPLRVAQSVARSGSDRSRAFGGRLPENAGPLTLAQAINATLTDLLVAYPRALVFGQDVAAKGGVYGVTKGLRDRFGPARVFDTLLDETSILGLALGSGLAGLLPIPEIQYLAYLHNAEDQLRGEAATMQFFSNGAYRNPMVVRVAAFGYQEGFGGHFHNDNAVGVLRDIPGLVVAAPARPDDAAAMLRTCAAAAVTDGTVSVFVEPIALYHQRDLYAEDDDAWLAAYPAPDRWAATHVPIGRARAYGDGTELTIVTYGNGLRLSLRVAAALVAEGIGVRVVDLRWLSPLPVGDILRESLATGRVLIVDETRRTGGVAEGVAAVLADAGFPGPVRRVAAEDSFIPLGPAARAVLVAEEQIDKEARALLVYGGRP